MARILLALSSIFLNTFSPVTAGFACEPGNLAVYTVRLDTFWTEARFPKQYPQWRPPPQWSKTVGFVHDASLSLFKIGDRVSQGVRSFVETGDAEKIEQEFSEKHYLDSILVPPILTGAGSSSANLFLDGNHSMVSMITKIVPSPDWFVGLDSIELCRNNQFIDQMSIQVDPLDAGTDNGFTFTSPNWPTEPQGSVFKITSTYPSHPAGSFNYPHLESLPTLAIFTFVKEREYRLNGEARDVGQPITNSIEENPLFLHQERGRSAPAQSFSSQRNENSIESRMPVESATRNNEIEETELSNDIGTDETSQRTREPESSSPDQNEATASASTGSTTASGPIVAPSTSRSYNAIKLSSDLSSGYHASTSPDSFFKKKYRSPYLTKAEDVVFHKELEPNKKLVLMNLLSSMQNKSNSKRFRLGKKKRLRRNRHKRHRKPRNCEVSAWSQWSACSKSCGIGESVRTRTILKHPRHGGHHCPKLREYKWCGSARNCKKGYFNW